jgi:hypothetical protein
MIAFMMLKIFFAVFGMLPFLSMHLPFFGAFLPLFLAHLAPLFAGGMPVAVFLILSCLAAILPRILAILPDLLVVLIHILPKIPGLGGYARRWGHPIRGLLHILREGGRGHHQHNS